MTSSNNIVLAIVSLVAVVAGILPSSNNFFAEGFSTARTPLLSKGIGQNKNNNNNKALWLASSVAEDFMKKSTSTSTATTTTTMKRNKYPMDLLLKTGVEEVDRRNEKSESTFSTKTKEMLLLSSLSSAAAAATESVAAAESVFIVENNNNVVAVDTDTAITTTATTKATTTMHKFTPLQHIIRVLPFITTGLYLYNPIPLDAMVENIYAMIYNWDIAQQPLFEAEVAVFGFFSSIIFFSSLHLFLGEDKTKQSRIDGKLPHKPFEWIEPKNWHLWFNPTAAYLGSIYIYLHYFHDKPPLPIEAPTFGVLAIETIFGIVLYDLCFMPIHYIMHNIKINKIRKIHGYHHRSGSGMKKSLNSLETVQHSYIDGFLQVFVNIMVQQISPFGGAKHVLSRLIHNLSVTYLLSEAHSGYSTLELMSHNIYPEIFGGSPRHETHHHNGRVYYQQYFKYIDDFFGFVIEDEDTTIEIESGSSSNNNAKDTTTITAMSSSTTTAKVL